MYRIIILTVLEKETKTGPNHLISAWPTIIDQKHLLFVANIRPAPRVLTISTPPSPFILSKELLC